MVIRCKTSVSLTSPRGSGLGSFHRSTFPLRLNCLHKPAITRDRAAVLLISSLNGRQARVQTIPEEGFERVRLFFRLSRTCRRPQDGTLFTAELPPPSRETELEEESHITDVCPSSV